MDKLRLNTNLMGFDGVIGRRDYFLNVIYICMIALAFNLPLSGYWIRHAETILDFFSTSNMFYGASLGLKLWFLPGMAFVVYLGISNLIRRLNDINGEVNDKMNYTIASFLAISNFGILFPSWLTFILFILNFGLALFLLFKKGKITGKYPYDFRKEFNWGAFFGTWLWGLFNKSFKTLWMLLLGLTPWGFYYALVCGLKGNEWAYKNKNWKSIEEFKTSQETQTIVFVVLNIFIIPLIIFALVFTLTIGLALTSVNEAKASPQKTSATMEKIEKFNTIVSNHYFEGYDITAKENKFYVLPKDWQNYSFSEKRDILNMAANLSVAQRKKRTSKRHYTQSTELNRTKIYSSTNGELLGEFVLEESTFNTEKPDFKEIIKSTMKAYRFYNPTKL